MNRAVFSLLVLAMVSWHNAPPTAGAKNIPGVSSGYTREKAYGYFIGDVVKVFYRLSLPPDLYLREDSVPGEGPHGEWVEVRGRRIRENATREMRNYHIELLYQVFFASDTAETFEIPGVEFRYGPRDIPSKESSAWASVPITVSPLTSPSDQFQPPMMWSWRSSTPKIIRGAGALLLLSGIGTAAFISARRLRRHSPLGKDLKRLSREEDPRAALMILRSALNEKAGQAIFPTNMEDLFRVFPEARVCERELMDLVLLSDEASFNPEGFQAEDGLHTKIAEAMKKMRRLEKWA